MAIQNSMFPIALNQFDIDDSRPVSDVVNAMIKNGLEPVWKDWMTFSTNLAET